MMSARCLVAFFCCLSPLVAQSAIAWRKDYHAARGEAVRDRKLMLVCFNHDGETASDHLAARVYRHPRFLEAAKDVVALVASSCRHAKTGPCPRFGELACADHQRVDGQAWHAVLGPLDTVTVPQHVVLFPDGRVAWHKVGDTDASALADALHTATAALARDDGHRSALATAALRSLVKRMKHGANDWLVARTLLAHAQPAEFPALFAMLGGDVVAERMLRELAEFPPAVVEPLLASLEAKAHPRLRATVASALLEVRVAAARADTAVLAAPATDLLEIRAPLPSLGKAESLAQVRFADGQARDLARGRVTVLWFFLPDAAGLADDIATINEFAAECQGQPVAHLALGGSLDPEASLTLVRLQKFAMPAGTYRYDEKQALCDITIFPTVVVLDPDGEIVYRGTSRTEHRALVRGMLASPTYAARLGVDARR